jgi:hypothetical protein
MLVPYFIQFIDRVGWNATDRRYIYVTVRQSAALHDDAWTVLVDDAPAFERLIAADPFVATWKRL